MSEGRLHGKVTIITGAAGGIGRAAALRFVEEGGKVVLVDLPGDALDETARQVAAAGGEAEVAPADVTDEAQVQSYVAAATDRFGRVDALLNNAGIEGPVRPLTDTPVDHFDHVLAVNVRGVFLGLKHAVPAMAASGGGAVVNVSSVAGLGGTPGIVAYGASKHAVIGLTKTAALEFAPLKVRVNAICPSPVETRMMRALEEGMNPDDPSAVRAMMSLAIPLGRYGEPHEIASLMAFLCSDESAFLSGAAIPIDGAMRAK